MQINNKPTKVEQKGPNHTLYPGLYNLLILMNSPSATCFSHDNAISVYPIFDVLSVYIIVPGEWHIIFLWAFSMQSYTYFWWRNLHFIFFSIDVDINRRKHCTEVSSDVYSQNYWLYYQLNPPNSQFLRAARKYVSIRARTIPPNTELNMAQKEKDRAGYSYFHGNACIYTTVHCPRSEDSLPQNVFEENQQTSKTPNKLLTSLISRSRI